MKIREAIAQVDESLANVCTQKNKISWLNQLDHRVKTKIIDTHEGREKVRFDGYDAETDTETELLVYAPYDEMYLRWLEAKIYYANQEEARYNNAMDLFEALWAEFRNDYNRTHIPLGSRLKY